MHYIRLRLYLEVFLQNDTWPQGLLPALTDDDETDDQTVDLREINGQASRETA